MASSRQASAGAMSAAATVQTVGARAPSQRIATVPVVAAYLIPLPTPSAPATSLSVIVRPPRCAFTRSAIASARRRPFAVSGNLPEREQREVALGDDVRVVPRPPQLDRATGSSHVAGSTPSTRACSESSAARGMLSWRPAHAARCNDAGPCGDRSSSPPTRRRNARICCRVSFSGAFMPSGELRG